MVAEPDDVARLLAAEDPAFPAERLEDVAVADGGRDHADPALGHEPVEAQVRHHGHGHEIDVARQREDREDLVAVERLAQLVDGEHPIAVAVERDPEICADLGRPRGSGLRGRSRRSRR